MATITDLRNGFTVVDTEKKKLEVGTILTKSWGYSMTIVQYYVVVRRTHVTAWVREIEKNIVDDNGKGNGTATPHLSAKEFGPVTRHKIHQDSDFHEFSELISPKLIKNEKETDPSINASNNIEVDIISLITFSQYCHNKRINSNWAKVLPIYPTSPIDNKKF